MTRLDKLETRMADVFIGKAPKLPEGGKKVFTEFAPWLSLLGGLLAIITIISVWNAAHSVQGAAKNLHALCAAYAVQADDCRPVNHPHLSLWLWLGIALLLFEAVLYLLAYRPLSARQKRGWDYLFYGMFITFGYGVISLLLSNIDVIGSFISAVVSSLIGFWVLFQIRDNFTNAHVSDVNDQAEPIDETPSLAPPVKSAKNKKTPKA